MLQSKESHDLVTKQQCFLIFKENQYSKTLNSLKKYSRYIILIQYQKDSLTRKEMSGVGVESCSFSTAKDHGIKDES